MSTLSFDGRVYHSDALERRQLVRIAPSVTVSHVVNRIRVSIENAEVHTISMADLPGDIATAFLFAVSAGTIDVSLTDVNDVVSVQNNVKMILMLDATIKAIVISGMADGSVYDMIAGGNA